MKLNEIRLQPKPEVGKCYKLRNGIGDFSNEIVFVETGPRNENLPSEQYRVSYGPGNYEVDWIDTSIFDGSIQVSEPPGIRHKSDK